MLQKTRVSSMKQKEIDWLTTKTKDLPGYGRVVAFYKKRARKEREENKKHRQWKWLGHHS